MMLDRRDFLVGGAVVLVAAQPVWGSTGETAKLIVSYSNQARKREGLRTLKTSRKLTKAAADYAVVLARTNRFSHNADGTTISDRLARHGFGNGWKAENIAWKSASKSPEDLAREFVVGWLNSSGHRRNLLFPKHTSFGVGVAGNNSRMYAVQVFWGDP